MEVFSRGDGVLCGAEEAHAYLRQIFSEVNGTHAPVVEVASSPARRRSIRVEGGRDARRGALLSLGLYETAILGILAYSWAGRAAAARWTPSSATPGG